MIYKSKMKELRTLELVSQKDIAKILNIGRSAYSQYEEEYVIIPLKHLNTYANYFKSSIDYIFEFNKQINYENIRKEINNKEAGKRLKEFRKENKLTQKALADYLATTQTVIAGYESGRRLIATPFLYSICKKYNISADYLLGKIDNPKYLK